MRHLLVSELKVLVVVFSVRDATVPKLRSATSEAKILSDGKFRVSLYNISLSFLLLLCPLSLVSPSFPEGTFPQDQ